MATILRSSKYIRCLNAFAQRIVGHDNGNFGSKCLTLQVQCINSCLTKSYATAVAVQRYDSHANLERVNSQYNLAKLDENIQRYGRIFKRELEIVLSRVRNSGYVSSLDGLLLVRCCGELMVDTDQAARNEMMQEVWNTLETFKIRMDVSHFNALLKVYLENNYEFSPIEILTKMKERGIEPNRVTYQRLILYNCKKGDIGEATKILEFMREEDIPLNESIFSALITGHSEANDMESAVNILNVMEAAGVAPCSGTYAALLCAYAKRGDMDSIKSIIAECGTKNLYLQDKELFGVIHVLVANGHSDRIDEILSVMPKASTYNFDAVFAILKILDISAIDVALKILSTMKKKDPTDESENESGHFFLRKLVYSKFPVEEVIRACEHCEQKGYNSRAFSIALEYCVRKGDVDLSISLLKAWKERGGTIREHYLWPLLVIHGKASNYQGIRDVLKVMTSDLGIEPGNATITDYILPYTVGKWDDIISDVKEFRITHKTIVNAIANRMLLDSKMRKTAMFMMKYPSEYDANIFYRPLAEALRDTEDVRSFVVILRVLHDSWEKSAVEEGSSDFHDANVIHTAVNKVIKLLPQRKHTVMNQLLDQLIEAGMSVSPQIGKGLNEYFQSNITPELSEKIDKLTSGTLVMPSISELPTYTSANDTDEITGGRQAVSPILGSHLLATRQQLSSRLLAQDIKGVEAAIKELETKNFQFSAAAYAQIIGMYCSAEDFEQAEKWVKKYKSVNSRADLDTSKSTSYAALLIKNDRFDDAVQFILDSPRKERPNNRSNGLKKLVKMLLDVGAGTGNVEKTNKLFEALVASNYLVVDNFVLGPLIKVHLVKNDLEGALDAFQNACETHQCTPLKSELSKKLIDAEDANSLQRLTYLSTQVHGESNSLIDLVLAFIECGRLRQARKIMETPGLRLRLGKLSSTATRYVDEGKHDVLNQLVEITQGLPVIDRHELYNIILDTYNKNNDWERGVSLWTEMQEDDIQPSQSFMTTLAALLKRNNQPVPFYLEEEEKIESDYVQRFNEAIKQGNLAEAEKLFRNCSEKRPELKSLVSELIETILVQRNDTDKAIDLATMLIQKFSQMPNMSTFRLMLNALIETGKYEKLKNFGNILSTANKTRYRFHKYLTRAAIKENGLMRFLDDFETQVTHTRKDNLALLENGFHFTTVLDEINKDPNTLAKLTLVAERLAVQRVYSPINVVWCYYFEKNDAEANKIWDKYLRSATRIVFKPLLESRNIEIIERLHNKISENKELPSTVKTSVLSYLVDAYIKNERHDDGLKILRDMSDEAVQHVKKTHQTFVQEWKKDLEANGKSLPPNFP